MLLNNAVNMPVILDEAIDMEIGLYVEFCEKAALHDGQEDLWKKLAHVTFYHIQELRSVAEARTPIS